jgi:tyrosyl-tRNA synthetase
MNVIDVLDARGFIEGKTHESELDDYVGNGHISSYIGFDPTASSLHIGSLVPIMSLAHMQRAGHRPIALVGGGTGLVGDPSGKTEMRKMLTPAKVEENAQGIKKQLTRFIDFDNDKAILVNNADWLTPLSYIEFLRDIGRHFSVNRMLKAESYRMRLDSEEGLNFIEFNYMLLQAYDFLELFNRYGCRLQMGGSDQWGNIVAGIELIRRIRQEPAFGLTFPLLTTSSGAKMGKTASGAVWLDARRTAPYEYYQYWVNTDDRDVEKFTALFTFLPMDEVRAIKRIEGAEINAAKVILAYETTSLAHGDTAALAAYRKTADNFSVPQIPERLLPSAKIHAGLMNASNGGGGHTTSARDPKPDRTATDSADSLVSEAELVEGIPAFVLFHQVGLADSKGAARRLIDQGGGYINGNRVSGFDYRVGPNDLDADGRLVLRAGKKRYHRLKVKI